MTEEERRALRDEVLNRYRIAAGAMAAAREFEEFAEVVLSGKGSESGGAA